eukprot:4126508-Prymnesium_polylepis.1
MAAVWRQEARTRASSEARTASAPWATLKIDCEHSATIAGMRGFATCELSRGIQAQRTASGQNRHLHL